MDSTGALQELNLAREVQQLLFPKSSPLCNWSCIGVKNRMAKGLGGDYFDFITMPDGCQVVFVGDVTGHGLHASVVMSLLYGYIHHSTMGECRPLKTVCEANRFLQNFAMRSQEYDHYFSSTIFYSIINPETLRMHYINAGHPAPMVLRDGEVIPLGTTAQPIGFFDNPDMDEAEFAFKQGDRLLLYTDGILETSNGRNDMFGERRLREILMSHRGDHLDLLDRIFDALTSFGAEATPFDDCTAIAIDFHKPLN